MRVRISRSLVDRLLAEAASSTDEVCGLLFGGDGRIVEARACANVAADPARHFEIDPADLFAAHRAARDAGPAIIGHYHSHPGGPPRPSETDTEASAKDGALWLIIGGGEMLVWRASEKRGFDAVQVLIEGAACT